MRDIRSLFTKGARLGALPLVLALAACGSGAEPVVEAESALAAEPERETQEAAGPRVFFVTPEDGASFPAGNPVAFEFGMENYDLLPVPEEVETPRAGVGHHHLGFNTECLPAGEVIPQSDPWVHFGDASVVFMTQLEPGQHTFVLQAGDDEHRTQADEGLCATVTIHVEEGI